MNSNKVKFNNIHNNYLSNCAGRVIVSFCTLIFILFSLSTAVLASTTLPKTPCGREADYQFFGIDVSEWQGTVDWHSVKNDGVDYAFIRAGGTTTSSFNLKEDNRYRINMDGSKSAGLARGIYWYSQATTEAEAVAEAKKLVELADAYDVELPLVMDLEFSNGRFDKAYNSWRAKGGLYAKERMTAVSEAFLEYCRSKGYSSALYLSTSLAGSFSGVDTQKLIDNSHEVWVAHYSGELSACSDFSVWQFTSTGRIAGISGNVDCDAMYIRKSPEKAGNQGIEAALLHDMVKYTGAPVTTDVSVSDNGKELVLNKDYTVSFMNNINEGDAYAMIKGKGAYVGYTEVIPFAIGDQELFNAEENEPSQVVTGIKGGKTSVKFTAAKGSVDDYRIFYKNDDNEAWKSVSTGGRVEYVIDGKPKYIHIASVIGDSLYGMAAPENSRKFEIVDGFVESEARLGGNIMLNRDKFKNINKEVSKDVVI